MPSALLINRIKDDTSMRQRPTCYVDYFSHDWHYEAIQRSWSYIVANTKEFDMQLD
ncbi:hypothetical protein M441DRAFT_70230 [Trichoderma asperellum CBS 433.97]|uniref:Uncharacterized protein n=1 Tax=Trichoderma asperellum (strain ATCC 204424 / CBS 433.97 / NBRC 101777) TaxID=1042311 RepID=A0A2T3Z6K3_TRIA4|nr:hypothetical protein M441DRAFT_70230 [Trichoderma asperellum CBS 433.97]PTB40438.1 hypothetical protein M441DRAFT_70230 [Trichoderma asperellum CBS 433.97]